MQSAPGMRAMAKHLLSPCNWRVGGELTRLGGGSLTSPTLEAERSCLKRAFLLLSFYGRALTLRHTFLKSLRLSQIPSYRKCLPSPPAPPPSVSITAILEVLIGDFLSEAGITDGGVFPLQLSSGPPTLCSVGVSGSLLFFDFIFIIR